MPTYVSLLRGINVSGQKSIRMTELQELFITLGFKQVRTYIQSGNVIFSAPKATEGKLCAKIQQGVLKRFGHEVPVLVRTAAELEQVAAANPFAKLRAEPTKLHISFLSEPPSPDGLKKLQAIAAGKDRFEMGKRVVYLHCPDGYGQTKLNNGALERALGSGATTRNWKTVLELCRLAASGA